ncbi:energy-coupling factor transporter ATPase [Lacrimispora saccharolytica]|nr:ABC transporter ATP-binding protein [Lachnospiraceae bacterium]MDM8249671.1 energy-coupling factor transporter ATPase [Lacrimispora saccharolytica]
MNVIEIRDLTYTYPGASRPTLDHLNLNVEKGDFLAIIGNNGCGKSTLCKTMNGLIPHFIAGEFQGSVLVDQQDTKTMDVGRIAGKVGYVYQDFENQIVRPTVLDDASYACMNYAMPDYLERGREALRQCGLEGREQEYIWQLSGGQTHLLALAGAVSLEPDVLILDEPIAQLDPKHADLIYGVLKNLNETWGKTIIVIEHHTEYIADYCHHVALLKDGHTEWVLPSDEALRRVEELQECNIFPPQVTIAAHQMKKEGMLAEDTVLPTTIEAGKKVFDRLLYRGEICTEWEAPGEKQKETESVVSFRKVSVSYRAVKGEAKQIFRNLNLEIKKGEKIALIGSNGAGKSTLMKLMTGLIKPSEGEILLKGKGIRDTKPEALSKMISLVYQNPEEMFIKDSIERDIAFAMEARNTENWQERTKALLEQFRLTELKDRDGRLLSGGQMRRASLAIGIALNPEILLLDEPTANLDIATRKEIMRTLNEMKDITETVLIATHDMQLVCEWAERIIVLCQGEVIADGSRNEIFGNRRVLELTGIRPPEIFDMGKVLNPGAFCYTIQEFRQQFGCGCL